MRLKDRRKAAGYGTQEALAKEMGVTRITVSRWESGIRIPRPKMLPELAKKLGCTVDNLLEG